MARRKDPNSNIRQKILSAANQLFIERGLDHTSLKDIALAAQISPGTLFYYYASKSALVFDVTDQHFDRLTHQLLAWVTQTQANTDLKQLLTVVFETIIGDLTRGKLHHYLIHEAASNDPFIRQRFQQKYAEWRLMIETGISSVLPNDERRPILAQIILATLDGLIIQAILGVQDLPIPAIVNCLVQLAPQTGVPYESISIP
jgi:AcrR family transcriptional regulator